MKILALGLTLHFMLTILRFGEGWIVTGTTWSFKETLTHYISGPCSIKWGSHPDKSKVLPVTLEVPKYWQLNLPFLSQFSYCLNGVILDHVKSEKDLGVNVSSRLSWTGQCDALRSKASSRLGLLKRTCHFVKNTNQRRVLYLAMVRSLFEHCSVIWSPSSQTSINKLEAVQKRAVRWILDEQYEEYDDESYLLKLHSLELLPIEFRLIYTDLSLFHKIIYKTVPIDLPEYIHPITEDQLGRLRSTQKDRSYLVCDAEEKLDVFKDSFFNRTRINWNGLPEDLRNTDCYGTFQSDLNVYIWQILLDIPEDISHSSFSSYNSNTIDNG